jgi:hypothetical protein
MANTMTGCHVFPAAICTTRWAISAAVGLTSSTPSSWLSSAATAWIVWFAQRQAGQLHKQRLGRLKGSLHRWSRRGLRQVPWRAAFGQLAGVIQVSESLLTKETIAVRTRQGDLADYGGHRARRRGSGRQETLTVGTRPEALVTPLCTPPCHQHFGDRARQLLAQGKHHLRQRLQARRVIGPVGLHALQSTVQVCMQLLAGSGLGKGLSSFLKGDHGCRGHLRLLHR